MVKNKSFIVITFNDKSTMTHFGRIADGLLEDFEYGNDPIVRYKDKDLFVGYPRENIFLVVYQK